MFTVAHNLNHDGCRREGRIISRHHKLARAVAAYDAEQARCKRYNGRNTWLDIGIFDDGDPVAAEDVYDARESLRG